jgi:hypothetical protein
MHRAEAGFVVAFFNLIMGLVDDIATAGVVFLKIWIRLSRIEHREQPLDRVLNVLYEPMRAACGQPPSSACRSGAWCG